MRDGDDLVNHDLGDLLEAVGRRWFNSYTEQWSVQNFGSQQTDGYAAKDGEEIGLEDKGWAGLATVMAFGGDGHDIAAFYALSQTAISEMKSRAGFSCADRAARRACRRHSAANPSARVSGTQICTGRNPLRRKRRR